MGREIGIDGIEGSLHVNDDGELVYSGPGANIEVLKPEQAIRRWPSAEAEIRRVLATLK